MLLTQVQVYTTSRMKKIKGFTLIEILVTIGIIGLLTTIVAVSLSRTTIKAKDTKRKAQIYQMGRFLQFGCRMPSDGSFDIDLLAYANQLIIQYPQYQEYLSNIPRDPTLGNETQSGYRYTISSDGQKCALYANLENEEEPVTLSNLSLPTPGGGIGILRSSSPGPNGTTKYYQFSN